MKIHFLPMLYSIEEEDRIIMNRIEIILVNEIVGIAFSSLSILKLSLSTNRVVKRGRSNQIKNKKKYYVRLD